jgi:hypothetical protein
MGVEILTKKEAELMKKDRKEKSKKILDDLNESIKRNNIELTKTREEISERKKLIDYVESKINDKLIRQKLIGMIMMTKLTSKQDIDKYINSNTTKEPENEIDSLLNDINNSFDIKLYYLYINNKLICKEKTIPKIKSSLKESYKNSVADVKGYLVSFTIDNKYKYPLMINCTSYTITPKLLMKTTDDDASQIFVYTADDLKKYGFNESHLFKIMKALKDESISFESNTVSISDVLKSSSKEPVKSKIKGVIKGIQKNQIENLIKDIEKPKPKDKARKTNKKVMDLAYKMITSKPSTKINTHKSSDKVIDAIFEVLSHKPMSKIKEHKSSESLIDTIFEVLQSKLPKGEKMDFTEGDEIIKKIKNKINSIIPTPANASETQKIDTLAKSITENPEFDNINRQKLEKYSFNIVYNFNEKYHNLMLKLFKNEEGIEKLLRKKTDNILKRKISEKKTVARKIKYAEAGKAKRAEAKAIKQKMVNELSPEEKKKYDQARNYYMRKSKTSTILPKNLNKDDPEALKFVCVGLATKGFDTMSEQLFMKELEE